MLGKQILKRIVSFAALSPENSMDNGHFCDTGTSKLYSRFNSHTIFYGMNPSGPIFAPFDLIDFQNLLYKRKQ